MGAAPVHLSGRLYERQQYRQFYIYYLIGQLRLSALIISSEVRPPGRGERRGRYGSVSRGCLVRTGLKTRGLSGVEGAEARREQLHQAYFFVDNLDSSV